MSSTKQYYTGVRDDEEKEEITRLIVRGRLPFSFVESDGFERAWKYRAQAAVILPRRWTIKYTAQCMCAQLKAAVKAKFTNVHRVSLTVDGWTSENNHHMLGITSHWIDRDWNLCEQVLALRTTEEEYDGETMGRIVGEVLAEFDLQSKFSADCHVPCVAHVLNLIVQAGLRSLRVTPMNELTSLVEDERDDVDTSYRRVSSSLGEAMARVRAVVRVINCSTKQYAKYVEVCKSFQKPSTKILLDCPTRWNSTFLMLRGAIEKKDVIDHMAVVVISSKTANYAIDKEEWIMLKDFCRILEPFLDMTIDVSASKRVTTTMVLVVIRTISSHLQNVLERFDDDGIFVVMDMLPFEQRQSIRAACEGMKQKFDRYASIIHHNQCVAFAALVDLTTKLALIEHACQADTIAYKRSSLSTSSGVEENTTPVTTPANQRQISSPIAMAIKQAKAGITTKSRPEPIQEFETYLAESCYDDDDNPLRWSKETGERFYPNLAKVANEYLSIPTTSTPSERLFSLGRQIVTYKRGNLNTASNELLCTLYYWMSPSSSLRDDESDVYNDDDPEEGEVMELGR